MYIVQMGTAKTLHLPGWVIRPFLFPPDGCTPNKNSTGQGRAPGKRECQGTEAGSGREKGGGCARVPLVKIVLTTLTLLAGSLALAQTATPAAPSTPTAPNAPAAPANPSATAPAPQPAAPATDPKAIVARVGGEEITGADFDQAFRVALGRLLNGQGMPFSEDMLAEFAAARPEYLKQLVRDRAVYQLARRTTKLDAAAVDVQLADIRKQFATDDAFKEALAQAGYAGEAVLKADIERQQVVNNYLSKLREGFKFGDAFVNTYYTSNRAKFERPAEACVKHILVPTEAAAREITTALAAGGDFAKLAQDKSQDPGSAAQGGDLGCFGPGQMVPEFDKASFSGPLNTPQTVKSQFGWHVLIVGKRNAAGAVPLAEAAPLIRDQLAREAAQKYLDGQVAKIKVESFPEVLQAPASK